MASNMNPRPQGGPDINAIENIQLPYQMQQQQAASQQPPGQGGEQELTALLADPQRRSQAAMALAQQGIEPPASLNELAPPAPATPGQQAQVPNPQDASQNLEALRQQMMGGQRG